MAMDKAISAAEANRKFSEVLREVKRGRSYIVTSHGRPVARISPLEEGQSVRSNARKLLFQRLRAQPVVKVGRWKRDELYE
jgi:prevent-host-death family protein